MVLVCFLEVVLRCHKTDALLLVLCALRIVSQQREFCKTDSVLTYYVAFDTMRE